VEDLATPDTNHDAGSTELRDHSTGELVKQLAAETTTLVKQELEYARSEAARIGDAVVTLARQELQLAKAEMAEKGRTAGPGLGMIGAAGAAAMLAAGTLTAFLVLALDGVMPNWLAALLIGGAWGLVALALYSTGKSRVEKAGPLIPEQAVETIKEDVQWAKTQIGSDTK
jgi:Putative Actinobacterial Holin-X, holin superfamily III